MQIFLGMSDKDGWSKFGKGVFYTGIVAVVLGGLVAFFGAARDFWGSRGTKSMYLFESNGRSAVVQKDDRIWAVDKYKIIVDDVDTLYHASLGIYEGKRVFVDDRHWSVRQQE